MADGGAQVRLGVLGPLEIRTQTVVLDVGPGRHREVLAALVVDAGRVVAVDTLVDRVWGEGRASAGTLQAIVSRLRGRLGDGLIVTQHPGYRLALDGVTLDAVEFARLLADARAERDPDTARSLVQEALGLWRDRPYCEVRRPFAEAEADRLEGLWLSAHELLADLELRLGRHLELVERLPSILDRHPLRESLRVSLMTALYRAGRQAEALATYDQGRQVLRDELGIDPGPELRDLHARILGQDGSLLATPAPAPAPAGSDAGVPASPPCPARDDLVGRTEQLVALDEVVRRGRSGAPTFAMVTGEAGIGKTRLVEAAAAAARDDGATVVWGRCWDHEGTPAFWPWEQALSGLVAALGVDAVRSAAAGRGEPVALLVPELGPTPAVAGAPGVARARLYDGVTAFLEAVSAERAVVLVLEDLHWSDQESIELAEYVATTLRAGRVAVLMTVRNPHEAPSTAADDLMAGLSRRPEVLRLRLRGLDVPQVRELVTRSIGSEVTTNVAAALRDRTDGNPFYLTELARLYGEERASTGRADAPVPVGVRAVIERRLRHLPPADLPVLVSAAVIGRSFDLSVLTEVAARPRHEVLDTVDRAVRAGVLSPDPLDGEQHFTHALVQETLTLSAGPMRRAGLHAATAEALAARHGLDPARAAAIAHHFAAAAGLGDPERGVEYSLLAASSAEQRLALAEAERSLRQALTLVGHAPPAVAKQLELEVRVRLGSMLTVQNGYNGPGVAEERRRAMELSAETGSTEHLLSALWGTWGNALVSGHLDDAETVVEQIAEAATRTGDPMLELAMHLTRGQTAWHRGSLSTAREQLEHALLLTERHADRLDLDVWMQHPGIQARGWLAVVLAMQGDVAGSDAMSAGTVELARKVGHPFSDNYQDILEGLRSIWLDRPELAALNGERGMATAQKHGFHQAQAFALLPLGWAAARLGDPARGVELLRTALAAFGSLPGGHMFGHFMLGLLADALGLGGRYGEALDVVDAALTESRRIGERFHLAELHRLRAVLLELLGRDPADDLAQAEAVATGQGAALFLGVPAPAAL